MKQIHFLRESTLSLVAVLLFFFAENCAQAVELPTLHVPHTLTIPTITAELRDKRWDKAAVIDALSFSPGVPVAEESLPQTQVKLLWDADFLYIRFICREDHDIYSPYRGRGAPYYRADVVEIFVDPVGDSREFVEVEVSPDNGVFDQLHLITTDPQSGDDGVLNSRIMDRNMWSFPGWNLQGLRHAASRWVRPDGSKGWLVDVALPTPLLKRTGLSHFAPMTLRANFLRYDYPLRGKEREFVSLNWSPVVAGRPHRSPARMGYLVLTDK
jgi:Carbohydrate family 9 binding domain-like